jgi:formylglycine-generating enzyme required for sulfatase activity/tRNA A-37 threonylcarbamoyl transferase component Bud32
LADAPPPAGHTPTGAQLDELGARLQAALGEAYAVEGRLGAGGFAVVFLVRDVHLKRKLAVKVLSPDVISSHSVLERFRREAETVAQLSHPHIVPLHFIGQKDDLIYLVMEAIGGGSLADKLGREKQLSIEDAARIFQEIASALAHAHKRGVVHRDIKPQNVLLDEESGRALVTDFGIARTAEGGSLTATGMVVGTPAYLSPEQVTGEPSDHRADIYALGVMMYEMLAGQPPFTGATPTAVLMKRLGGPPPPLQSVRADIPTPLADVVEACLATDPNERIQNAADIVRSMTGHSPVSGGHTTSTRMRVTKKKSGKRLLAGIGVGIVALAIAAGYLASRDGVTAAAAAPVDAGMALIPAGTYMIGDNEQEATRPAHAVPLVAFGLDTVEVTVGDYNGFLRDHPGLPAPWTSMPDSLLPVTGVRWAEARSYCAWRHPEGGRLPSEEEWEAAARGLEGRKYAWGRDWKPDAANVNNRRTGPAPVGSYPGGRTPDGIHDLIGNVWEWTSSPHRPYGNPNAAATGMYVIRGGGFSANPAVATAVARIPYDPATDRKNLTGTGFRCAMTARSAAR